MHRRIVFGLTAAVFAAAFAFSAGSLEARADKQQATGAGHVDFGAWRSFSFTAQNDGTPTNAKGQVQLNNRNDGNKIHAEVNCLWVVGNIATVSGVITHSNSADPNLQVGSDFWFQVIDNGEGNNAPPDLISLFFGFGPPGPTCTQLVVPATIPIVAGNIQVKD